MYCILLLLFFFCILFFTLPVERFGWNCTYTPNKDYYKEDWILGDNPVGQAMARDAIKRY